MFLDRGNSNTNNKYAQFGKPFTWDMCAFSTHIVHSNKKITLNKQNPTLLSHTNPSSKDTVDPSISQKYFWGTQR